MEPLTDSNGQHELRIVRAGQYYLKVQSEPHADARYPFTHAGPILELKTA